MILVLLDGICDDGSDSGAHGGPPCSCPAGTNCNLYLTVPAGVTCQR